MSARWLLDRHLLEVGRNDEAGDGALGQRDAHRAIDEMRHLLHRHRDLHELGRDVLEQRQQVDLLLVMAPERHPLLLADDGQHRRMVELGVIEPVEQVDRARPRGRHAHPYLTGELGVRARREGRELLVASLDELGPVDRAVECQVEPGGAVSGIAVHTLDPPIMQSAEQKLTNRRGGHDVAFETARLVAMAISGRTGRRLDHDPSACAQLLSVDRTSPPVYPGPRRFIGARRGRDDARPRRRCRCPGRRCVLHGCRFGALSARAPNNSPIAARS